MNKKYSFYNLIEDFRYIEIPALQRDYAQGRKNEQEVRDSFLSYLRKMLIAGQKDTLDFIYGISDDKISKLILIDGQQRITTLFLLYWFLAVCNGEECMQEFRNKMLDSGNTSRFRYATRHSAKEFCNKLVERIDEIDINLLSQENISEIIKNMKWFQPNWINDSTVKAMLLMLDSMQREFLQYDCNLYKKLEEVFKVDFLQLEDYSLHDAGRLYIRMNSRGKPLSRYENLKTLMLIYIRENEEKYKNLLHHSSDFVNDDLNGLSFTDKIGWFMDVRWTDALWNKLQSEGKSKDMLTDSPLDRIMLNLIVLPIMNECCVEELRQKTSAEKGQNQSYTPVDKSYINESINSLPYDSIFEALDQYDKDGHILSGAINFLNGITFLDDQTRKWQLRRDIGTYPWISNYYFDKLFTDIRDKQQFTFDMQLRLYTLYLFIARYGDNLNLSLLKEWLRFCENIIDATNLDKTVLTNSLSSLSRLCEDFPALHQIWSTEKSLYPGLDKLQIEEEVIKRKLSKSSPECAEAIIEEEEKLFPYFHGQLRYPLSYSKLINGNYSPEALNDFKTVCEVLSSIFIKHNNPDDDIYILLTRALLTKGEYMLKGEKNNGAQSLLILNDRDYSWKRYLKEEHTNNAYYFDMLIEDICSAGTTDIEYALNAVINNCNTDNLPSWRKILILNKSIWGKVRDFNNKKEIRIWVNTRNIKVITDNPQEDAWVYPIKKNLQGNLSELFSLDLYTHIRDSQMNLSPFTELWYYRGEFNKAYSCAVINNWKFNDTNEFAIDIYRKQEEPAAIFCVRFFDRNINANPEEEYRNIDSRILSVLSDHGFEYNSRSEAEGYYAEWKGANNECLDKLAYLLDDLNALT